jgi:hypothetical protein
LGPPTGVCATAGWEKPHAQRKITDITALFIRSFLVGNLPLAKPLTGPHYAQCPAGGLTHGQAQLIWLKKQFPFVGEISQAQGMTMTTLLILAAIIGFSASAFAQTAGAKGGGKLKQLKPAAPMGCKLVGTVKGTKLWAGDCAAASELRGISPAAEPAAPAPSPEANPPAAKQ